MHILGLDIGGANLKAADSDGQAASRSFPIWQAPEQLANELALLIHDFPQGNPFDAIAVTMTAELADCFATKAEGVDHILRAVETIAESTPVFVWQTGAEFVTPNVAREFPLLVAAANWHALAIFIGRLIPTGTALLIDIGSTTTDIIPLLDGFPVPRGLTDVERLQSGELVYTGVRRTPIAAVTSDVPFHEGRCPLAAELFATTLDVHLLLGNLDEDSTNCETANGKPATRLHAANRLAHMICCDTTECTEDDLATISRFLAETQIETITSAAMNVLNSLDADCSAVLVSGIGSFLANRVVQNISTLQTASITQLDVDLGPAISEAACAYAVAQLGSERLIGLV
jgi:probable H4MPT-linked C1 transfer pathway protein